MDQRHFLVSFITFISSNNVLTVHPVPKCRSCSATSRVITGRGALVSYFRSCINDCSTPIRLSDNLLGNTAASSDKNLSDHLVRSKLFEEKNCSVGMFKCGTK